MLLSTGYGNEAASIYLSYTSILLIEKVRLLDYTCFDGFAVKRKKTYNYTNTNT
jgi:hypothetical protein